MIRDYLNEIFRASLRIWNRAEGMTVFWGAILCIPLALIWMAGIHIAFKPEVGILWRMPLMGSVLGSVLKRLPGNAAPLTKAKTQNA